MRKTCLDMVYELAQKDERIFFIGSDLGVGTLQAFKQEMPGRFFMEGVSEANLVGMACGLAMEGKIVYVNTIATFLTRRCFEQIVIDACLHKANIRLIANGGGLVYAPLGPTHLATDDIAILRTVPNMTIIAPADAHEMRQMMPETINHEGPIYIRLAKGHDPIVTQNHPSFQIGKVVPVCTGKGALIMTTGITLRIALETAKLLEQERIATTILHVPTIKPLDKEAILRYVRDVPVIVTVEEHTIVGGLGSAVAEIIAENNFDSVKYFKRIGIPDAFADEYGSQESLMARYDLTAEHVADVIKQLKEKSEEQLIKIL